MLALPAVGCPAMLGPGARRATRSASCGRCAQTGTTSQLTKRVGTRAAPVPVLLGCAYSPQRPPGHGLAGHWGGGPTAGSLRFSSCTTPVVAKQRLGLPGAGSRQCAPQSGGAEGGACTHAHQALTRRVCLSAATAGRVASYATRHHPRPTEGTLTAGQGKHCARSRQAQPRLCRPNASPLEVNTPLNQKNTATRASRPALVSALRRKADGLDDGPPTFGVGLQHCCQFSRRR